MINELEKYGKEKKVKFTYSMTTNGTSNSAELLYLIKKFDIDLSISIDGRFETQNENRPLKNGKSSFHIVSNFIDKILSMDISPRIRMTYNSKDVKYIFKNVSFLIEKGLECIVAHHNSYDPDWSYEHVDELKTQIQMLKARYGDKENLLINLTKEISDTCKGKCSCGESELVVFTNGDLYTCTWCAGDGEHIIGNVSDGICREKLDYYKKIANSKNLECEGCAIYDLCENVRCKLINKSRSGFYDRVLPIDCLIKNGIVECNGIVDN